MIDEGGQVYEFDDFRLDGRKRQLTKAGAVVPLYSKAFDLLLALVQSDGRDLSKDELLESVWPGQILEESNLPVNISAIRRALGEKASQPHYIVTVPGRGYRFIGAVQQPHFEASGVIVTSETISQITVEQETVEDGQSARPFPPQPALDVIAGPATLTTAIASQPLARQLIGSLAPPVGFLRRPAVLAALIPVVLVIGLAVFFVGHKLRRPSSAANRFQDIKLRQLTNGGKVFSAAISPDGKFFAYVQREKGKSSLQLGQTSGEAPLELRPVADVFYRGLAFGPDGRNIYYVIEDDRDKRSLFRLPVLGGVPVKLRDGISGFFAIAPDEKRVAFVRGDTASKTRDIVISDLDGANESVMLLLPAKRNLIALSLSWSPDGSTLAFAASPDENQRTESIFLLQVADKQLKALTTTQWREIVSTSWLSDGSGVIAVAAGTAVQELTQLWFVAYPSGEVRRITNDLNSYDVSLSSTADAHSLLAVEYQQINNIWVSPAADLAQTKQVTFGALNRGEGGLGIDWTPSGKIVYTASVAQSVTLWIMDGDGTNSRALTPPGFYETSPSVTGDGRFIVFESNRSGASEIWRVDLDGSNPKQLTTCGRNFQPSATPDGKWVVYRSSCEADPGLWRVSIDGGQPLRLTEKSALWPWVSPDSKWVACQYVASAGKEQLAIVPIEGGGPVKVFDIPPLANFRYGIKWSADGKAITYRDWASGLWRQPIEGGAAQRISGLPDEKIYSYGWSRDGKLFAFTRGNEIRDIVLITAGK